MLPHDAIRRAICGAYTELSDRSAALASPFTVPGDGGSITAYIVAEGERYRVTDDGDSLFNAATHGVVLTQSRRNVLNDIAGASGVSLAQDGELLRYATEDELPVAVTALIEAAANVSFACSTYRPRPSSVFERAVGAVLAAAYGPRLVRRIELPGDSGRQLQFSFGLDVSGPDATVIQVIPTRQGSVDWSNVHKQVGKFDDLIYNEAIKVQRIAVLEPTDDPSLNEAMNSLHRKARVLIYAGAEHLVQHLDALTRQ